MRMPPLPADSIHARACKLKCEKILTRPVQESVQPFSADKVTNRLEKKMKRPCRQHSLFVLSAYSAWCFMEKSEFKEVSQMKMTEELKRSKLILRIGRARRLYDAGKNAEEIAAVMREPIALMEKWINNFKIIDEKRRTPNG